MKGMFEIIDADRSDFIDLTEFMAMEQFDGNFFMSQVVGLVEWLVQTFGDFSWAFDEVRAAARSDGAKKGEMTLGIFRRGLTSLNCPLLNKHSWRTCCGIGDPARSLFCFFDSDHSSAISREEWTRMMMTFNVNVGRDGITNFKFRLEDEFGSLAKLYVYLVRFRQYKENHANKQGNRLKCRRDAVSAAAGRSSAPAGPGGENKQPDCSRYAKECLGKVCNICEHRCCAAMQEDGLM